MEPPEEVRRWVNRLVGMAPEGNDLSSPLDAWEVLGPALDAVNRVTLPMETEPATRMVFPEPEGAQPQAGRGDSM